jgi:hypothetical protein
VLVAAVVPPRAATEIDVEAEIKLMATSFGETAVEMETVRSYNNVEKNDD